MLAGGHVCARNMDAHRDILLGLDFHKDGIAGHGTARRDRYGGLTGECHGQEKARRNAGGIVGGLAWPGRYFAERHRRGAERVVKSQPDGIARRAHACDQPQRRVAHAALAEALLGCSPCGNPVRLRERGAGTSCRKHSRTTADSDRKLEYPKPLQTTSHLFPPGFVLHRGYIRPPVVRKGVALDALNVRIVVEILMSIDYLEA